MDSNSKQSHPVNVLGDTACYDDGLIVCQYYGFGYRDNDDHITWENITDFDNW